MSEQSFVGKLLCVQMFWIICELSLGLRKLLNSDDEDLSDIFESFKDSILSFLDSIVGKECLTDSGCAKLVAFCDRSQGFSGSLGK